MSTSPISAPSAQEEGAVAQASSLPRPWSADDVVVVLFALLGLTGGVILPVLLSSIPPITTSFLLATGLAALTYRFLGGIQASSVTIGALKLTGSLAALVGVAMLIDNAMVTQEQQAYQERQAAQEQQQAHQEQMAAQEQRGYEVTGFVNDETGKPVPPSQVNFSLSPQNIFYDPGGGLFRIDFTTGTDLNGQQTFPTLYICDGNLSESESIDLDPTATKNVVPMKRTNAEIDVGTIQLKPQGGRGCPSSAQ